MTDQILQLGIRIVATRARAEEIDELPNLEDRVRLCFRLALDDSSTWFVQEGDDSLHFRIGVGALLTVLEPHSPEWNRVETSLRLVNSLNATISGVPVDWGSLVDDDTEVVPLLPLYQAVKTEVSP